MLTLTNVTVEAIRSVEAYLFFFCGGDFIFREKTDTEAYVSALEAIENEYLGNRCEAKMSAMLYSLIMTFLEEEGKEQRAVSSTAPALYYMEEHFSEKITVEELAGICHLSKSAFCKHFKENHGCTAFQRLTDIRLLNAELILKLRPDEKIYAVAEQCGFTDAGYFCKAYKKRFGISPSDAR